MPSPIPGHAIICDNTGMITPHVVRDKQLIKKDRFFVIKYDLDISTTHPKFTFFFRMCINIIDILATYVNAAKFLFYRPPVWLISELQKLEWVFKSIPFLSVFFFLSHIHFSW